MLDGLADYRINGLGIPARVRAATAGYRNESDTVAAFIAGCDLTIDPALTLPAGELLQLHAEWWGTYGTGEPEKAHYQRVITHLKANAVSDGRTRTRGRFWRGIGLLEQRGDDG